MTKTEALGRAFGTVPSGTYKTDYAEEQELLRPLLRAVYARDTVTVDLTPHMKHLLLDKCNACTLPGQLQNAIERLNPDTLLRSSKMTLQWRGLPTVDELVDLMEGPYGVTGRQAQLFAFVS